MIKTDIEIAKEAKIRPITEVAKSAGIPENFLEQHGKYKAKIDSTIFDSLKKNKDGKLILVTAISPTPAGEGKTTVSVGLGDALRHLGKNTIICLREPSLGPVFGVKGGATGGGHAQVIPMEDINLHFTGDFHAITSANNLLSAMIDNHIHHGNELDIDLNKITWKRCLDMNDRALRKVDVGLGGKFNGVPRPDGFDITVASEIMAILCLSNDIHDLKQKLGNIIVAYNAKDKPVFAKDINAHGAMATLLKDAIKPNLAQTIEGTPAILHGGPFANIAHGCNSVIATKLSLKLGDFIVTEAGFGADLGMEKFMNIKCRKSGLAPDAVVLVATIRSLKHQGDGDLSKGLPNLTRHIENITEVFGLPCVVAINNFPTDEKSEIEIIKKECARLNVDCKLCEVHAKGGRGGEALAKRVIEQCESKSTKLQLLYKDSDSVKDKINSVATKIYRAKSVNFSDEAIAQITKIEKMGYSHLPICIAKTQYSFSDDPKLLVAPTDFSVTVKSVRLCAGAGFIVVLLGNIMTMPGLPKSPAAEKIDIDKNGQITGLF